MTNRPLDDSAADPSHPIEVSILGPLEVRRAGAVVALPGQRHRELLVDLVLRLGRRVTTEVLVDHLWGAAPPTSATKTIHKYVSELRRALGTGARDFLATDGHGYVLRLPPRNVDAHRFESLVSAARPLPDAEAVVVLREAEALWRGPALEELAHLEWVQPTAESLDGLHLTTIERRLGLLVALGRHQEALPGLEQLTIEHPLREELWAHLMIAYGQSGRRDDALGAFHRARLQLAAELGIDPSSRLRDIERRILEGNLDGERDRDIKGSDEQALNKPTPEATEGKAPSGEHPHPVGTFIGRTQLLDQLGRQLAEARLVTLTGAGGSGKTRVAIEAMSRCSDQVDGRAWFVDLSTIDSAELVAPATAKAVGLRDQPATDSVMLLKEALGSRRTLLVLDNCEHVIGGAAPLVAELLTSCSGLRILATSREPLGIAGEYNRPIPPLKLPAAGGGTGEIERCEAVQLFLVRAREADPSFAIDDHNRAAVADICTRLDGMPLALELAAAQLRAMSPSEMAERLDDRFRILGSGGGRPPRHATLQAAIDWSYELLTPDERRIFERVSVFPGTFDLAAATAVCSDDSIDDTDVVALIARLVRQSVVIRSGDIAGSSRYRLLDTLRTYARGILTERRENLRCRAAHGRHFAELVDGNERSGSPGGEEWHRAIGMEHHNLQVALAFGVESDPELGGRLVFGLCRHWTRTDRVIEGLRSVERLLDGPDLQPEQRAKLLCCAAELRSEHGEAVISEGEAVEALGTFERIGDDVGASRAQFALGQALGNGGDYGPAIDLMEQSIRSFAATDTNRWASGGLALGRVRLAQGDDDRAEREFSELLSWARRSGVEFIAAKAHWLLGATACHRGRLAEAREQCEQALATFTDLDERSAIAHVQMTLGDIARLADDPVAARALYGDAFAALTDIGDRRCTASAMKNLGDLERSSDVQHSAVLYLECLDRRQTLGDRSGAAEALEGLAEAIGYTGHATASATLLGQAESLRADTGSVPPEVERAAIADLERHLGDLLSPAELASARSAGAASGFEDAVAAARSVVVETIDIHQQVV